VVILGGGVVGTNSAKLATGMGAETVVLDVSLNRLAYLDDVFGSRITPVYSDPAQIRKYVREADLVIGGVLIPGAKAPHLITREMLGTMKPASVLVDVAIDQGGCFETSRPTTHTDPTYVVDGVLHYCVANMPGAVPITSTKALTNATLPYVEAIATHGLMEAVAIDPGLAPGVNVLEGKVTYEAVAEAHGLPYTPLFEVLV
jgi:alanine dehydrogenase